MEKREKEVHLGNMDPMAKLGPRENVEYLASKVLMVPKESLEYLVVLEDLAEEVKREQLADLALDPQDHKESQA